LQAGLEPLEDIGQVAAADREAADHPADRAYGGEQAPERAEETEEDQQADDIARQLAPFLEPARDAVQQGLHRRGRQREPPARALAQHGRHRREQPRRGAARDRGLVAPEALDPAHFRP
jgi:hypothetical protein